MFAHPALEIVEIPYVPPQVDMADIHATNGRLIPIDQIERVKKMIADAGNLDGRYPKKILGTPFSVNKVGDQYFAVYKGVKHQKELGAGGFGTVKLLQNIDDGTWAVVKTIPFKQHDENNSSSQHAHKDMQKHDKSVKQEIANLTYAQHFLGHFQRHSNKKNVVQDEIMMVLAPGTSLNLMLKEKVDGVMVHRKMPAVKWLDLCLDAVKCIKQLHDDGILHRDIKPANFIWHAELGLVAVDFGLARAFDKNRCVKGYYAGTHQFMAPEISKRDHKLRTYNEATEVYALGRTLYEILSLDFDGGRVTKSLAFIEKIKNTQIQDELVKLISCMLDRKPEKRPRMDTVIQKLSELRRGELDLMSKVSSLVYLNIHDYHKMSDEQKATLFASLKNADEVILCLAPNPWAKDLLTSIRHELESHGICVAFNAIVLRGIDAEQHYALLKENTRQHCERKQIICNSFYLKTSSDLDPGNILPLRASIDSLELHDIHKKIAEHNVQRQIDRIVAKNPNDQRLQFMRKFRYDLREGVIRTYRQLFAGLEQLEKDLNDNEQPSLRRSLNKKLFGIESTSALMVRQTSRDIVDDVHGRTRRPTSPFNKK